MGVLFVGIMLIGLGVGLTLLTIGVRGNRIDDHPWCVACRFDLFALPETTRTCPECGADIKKPNAVRIGQRRHKPRLAVTGAVMVLLFGTPLGLASFADIDWNRYKPLVMLKWELQSDHSRTRRWASEELARRIADGDLSDEQVAALLIRTTRAYLELCKHEFRPWRWKLTGPVYAGTYQPLMIASEEHLVARINEQKLNPDLLSTYLPLVLDVQGSSEHLWISGTDGKVIEMLYQRSLLPAHIQDQYETQSVIPFLIVRERIGLSDPIPFVAGIHERTGYGSNLRVNARIVGIQIDGQQLSDIDRFDLHNTPPLGIGSISTDKENPLILTKDRPTVQHLQLGKHKLSVDFHVEVTMKGARANPIHTLEFSRSAEFEIVSDKDAEIEVETAFEGKPNYMGVGNASISDPYLWTHDGDWQIAISVPGPWWKSNLNYAFDVFLEVGDDDTVPLGSMMGTIPDFMSHWFYHSGPSPRPQPFKVILEPSPEAAKRTIDIYKINGRRAVITGKYFGPPGVQMMKPPTPPPPATQP